MVAGCTALSFRRYKSRGGAILCGVATFLFSLNLYITNFGAKGITVDSGLPLSFVAVIQGVVPFAALLATLILIYHPLPSFKSTILLSSLLCFLGNILCSPPFLPPSPLLLTSGRFLIGLGTPLTTTYRYLTICVPPNDRSLWWFVTVSCSLLGLATSIPLSFYLPTLPLSLSSPCPPLIVLWSLFSIVVMGVFSEPDAAFKEIEGLSGLTPFETVNWNPRSVGVTVFVSRTAMEGYLTACPVIAREVAGHQEGSVVGGMAGCICLILLGQALCYTVSPTHGILTKSTIVSLLGSSIVLWVTEPSEYLRFWAGLLLLSIAISMCDQYWCECFQDGRRGGVRGWRGAAVGQSAGMTLGNLLVFVGFWFPEYEWTTIIFAPASILSLVLLFVLVFEALRPPAPN